MRKGIITVLVFIWISAAFRVKAQIVNVESQRIHDDSSGIAGSFGGNFSLTKNVDKVFLADVLATVQYKTGKNTYLLLGDYSFLKGAEKQFVNKTFSHFRYDHKFTSFFRLEAFTQLQANEVTKIEKRFLLGAGPRFKLPMPPALETFVGVLFMYEYEQELTKPPVYHRVVRNSSYLTLTYSPTDNVKLISTTFYQPRINRFKDFRILNQESFNFSVTKKLTVSIDWSYLYDAFPVIGIPKENYTLSTGLKYSFNP